MSTKIFFLEVKLDKNERNPTWKQKLNGTYARLHRNIHTVLFINAATETVTEMTITFLLSFDEFNFEWTNEQSVFDVATIVFVSTLFLSAFADVVVDVVLTVAAVAVVVTFVAFIINLYIGSWTDEKVGVFTWAV